METEKSNTRKALILGATGLIGGYCLENLLKDSEYSEVTALARKPLLKTHRKLKAVITQFSNLEAQLASVKVDDVFCCLGTTIKKAGSQEAFKQVDSTLVVTIAELMRKRGSEQFLVVSAMGANTNSKVFYNQVKGGMEQSLQDLDFPCLRIIRPSLLLGPRQEFRFGEKIGAIVSPILSPLLFGPMKKYRPVEAETVAKFMVAIANKQPRLGNYIYESDVLK
jgi:uncharacterized protein YbjT (DUF2867 family)